MAELNQFEEKSDLFFRGELSPKEEKDFQSQLDSDPLLKEEFELNNSIVNGIKQYRSAQLKARLSAITINPFPVNFWAGVGSAAIVTGVTATLIYQAVKPETVELSDESPIQIEEVRESKQAAKEAYDISEDLNEKEGLDEAPMKSDRNQDKVKTQISNASDMKFESNEEVMEKEDEGSDASELPQINLPVAPSENSKIERSGDEDINSINRANFVNEKLDVDVRQHPEYSFHYQYSDHKLFIYGSLDKEPYRLLELDQKGQISLYLAYDGKYYFLANQTISPEPLKPIRDRYLLKNLRELDSGN